PGEERRESDHPRGNRHPDPQDGACGRPCFSSGNLRSPQSAMISPGSDCSCPPEPGPVLAAKDFRSALKPIWCPGCGDYGVVNALYRALAAIGRPPHEIAFVSGIGCSSRIPGYTTAYGFNSVHGRALPI